MLWNLMSISSEISEEELEVCNTKGPNKQVSQIGLWLPSSEIDGHSFK